MGDVPCRICTPVDRLARRVVHEIAVDLEAPDAPDLGTCWTGKANQHSQHHEPCPLERPFRRDCLYSHSPLLSSLQAPERLFQSPRRACRDLAGLVWRAMRGRRTAPQPFRQRRLLETKLRMKRCSPLERLSNRRTRSMMSCRTASLSRE